jgi:kynurenine formamidase
MRYPTFAELPFVDGTTERHAWDVFGRDDELGCLNFAGPEQVLAATREVKLGRVVNLNLPLGQPQPQFWASRPVMEHTRVVKRNVRDDEINHLGMQTSTQWDGLGHQRFREHGYFGGRQEDALDRGELGIERWAERGMIVRGVLVDVLAYLEAHGQTIQQDQRFPIGAELLAAALERQGTTLQPGDVLLVRTGWLRWYTGLDTNERDELATLLAEDRSRIAVPGLDPRVDTIAWLWDSRIAAAAFDNPTAETVPYVREHGWAHIRLISLLGLTLGELWQLDELADVCAAEGRYSFMLSAPPLNLRGGVGSPANAYAVL